MDWIFVKGLEILNLISGRIPDILPDDRFTTLYPVRFQASGKVRY